jgi:uncharacterized repeat protein (TIGR01451 family)
LAEVRGDEWDPDTNNNRVTESTRATAEVDLSVSKSDSPDPVIAGTLLTYTLIISNLSTSEATGLILTDTLPTQTTFISAAPSQGTCDESGGTVTCALGDLDDGGAMQVTIVASVSPSARGAITNTAHVRGSEADPESQNNSATQQTTVLTQVFVPVLMKRW